ncbi:MULTISPECIES: hypothetical protein [Rhodobacterales]|uniref:hypothetical protein n=1 Tax=Roseobacter sp. N2S TaxID=2663844 RepID=UPI00286786D5|nr:MULTISPECIES: hypothetical protein [Rhodobacterales]MDR6264228.1 hypothetical protein [Roseobacter sp. N2S]
MDPVILLSLWNSFAAFILPFMAFAAGVYISDVIGLNSEESRKNIYLMAMPVGMLTVGILLSGTTVKVMSEGGLPQVHYGHMQSFGIYLVFCGTIMFYGTLVPQLFKSYRDRFKERVAKDDLGLPNHGPAGGPIADGDVLPHNGPANG